MCAMSLDNALCVNSVELLGKESLNKLDVLLPSHRYWELTCDPTRELAYMFYFEYGHSASFGDSQGDPCMFDIEGLVSVDPSGLRHVFWERTWLTLFDEPNETLRPISRTQYLCIKNSFNYEFYGA